MSIENDILEEFEKYKKDVKKPNILLAGATGVGKSTLINKIFGENVADAGKGKPVTMNIQKYENDNLGVILYDSPGYEIGSEKALQFEEEVINIKSSIHLVWYCIASSGDRVIDFDLNAIRKFRENGLDVSVLFTKSDISNEDDINKLKQSIAVIANIDSYIISSKSDLPIFKGELDRLIINSIEKLPETLKIGFISAQRISLKEKWNRGHSVVAQHVAGAFAVGFAPIPFADAPILIANQMTMVTRILYIYGLDSFENMLVGGGTGGIIGQIVATLGKTAVGGILKFIPGIGTLLGGLINGAVASLITTSLGEAANISCYKLYESILNGNKDIDKQIALFGENILKYSEEYMKSNKKSDDFESPN